MKEMTLKEIQSVCLDILNDVHTFCIENHITYSLYGGTMIGAIRHQGFIPWDDDLDIAMPRPYYEKFIRTYTSKNGYELKCHERHNSQLAFARVCEMKKTLVTQSLPWCNENTGVYIDIFPLDGAPDNIKETDQYIHKLYWSWTCVKLNRVSQRKLFEQKTYKRFFNVLIRKILFRNPFVMHIDWTAKHIEKCKKIPYGSTNHFINAAFMEYKEKEYQEIDDFKSTIYVSFEEKKFCVCNGFDHLMRKKYGNYMQEPPKSEQKLKHGGSMYFWR